MADDDPMIPVMLPTSVVTRLAEKAPLARLDWMAPVYEAARDAVPKLCTIEIPVETRGLWADRPLGAYTRDFQPFIAACRASRDAEASVELRTVSEDSAISKVCTHNVPMTVRCVRCDEIGGVRQPRGAE